MTVRDACEILLASLSNKESNSALAKKLHFRGTAMDWRLAIVELAHEPDFCFLLIARVPEECRTHVQAAWQRWNLRNNSLRVSMSNLRELIHAVSQLTVVWNRIAESPCVHEEVEDD